MRRSVLNLAVAACVTGSVLITCAPDASRCNGTVGPFVAPQNPSFTVNFGTVLVFDALDLSCPVEGGICRDGNSLQLIILMTPKANACPANWLFATDAPGEDKQVLWLEALVPGVGPYTGTFTSTRTEDIATAHGDEAPMFDGPDFGNLDTAAIASAVFDKNVGSPGNSVLKSVEYASGTITLTSVTPGVNVVGSFTADFPDGQLSGSFDVPFCATACGCTPYEPGMTSGFRCESLRANPLPADASADATADSAVDVGDAGDAASD